MHHHSRPMLARVPRFLKWLVSRPPTHASIVVLLGADLAALGDAITGPDVWFGPVYLLVICVAAWSSGWRAGLITGLGCLALTHMINGARLYPYDQMDWVPNLALRSLAIATIVVIVAGTRSVYLREWWLARTDPLTGAFNRQAFFELGQDLAAESSWRLLIYADLDGLKKINDLHGHAAGDGAIKEFAKAVGESIRKTDIFARVGGDEFVIFMRVRDRASADAVASRIHERMNSIAGDDQRSLRCSVGGLIVPPGEMKIDRLVRMADTLMYQAKLRGACLQMQVAQESCQSAGSGRARKTFRMPDLGSATDREAAPDRREIVLPVARPTSSEVSTANVLRHDQL